MAIEADLSNATAEDLIVVMAIVGCKDDELRGDLQKLEAPKLADIIKLGQAHERKTFAETGFAVKVNAVQTSTGTKPKVKLTDDPVRRKKIKRLMKGKCYRCREGHHTDQCSQKGSSLKCTTCNRKGHVAKACHTEMLKKSGTVKTSMVSAAAPGTPALGPLLKKGIAWIWTEDMQREFERVKLLLTTTTTVQPFNRNLTSILMTDVSRLFGIGFSLLQPLTGEKWSLIQCGSADTRSDQVCYHQAGMHGYPVGNSEMFIQSSWIRNFRGMDRSQAIGRHFPEKHLRPK